MEVLSNGADEPPSRVRAWVGRIGLAALVLVGVGYVGLEQRADAGLTARPAAHPAPDDPLVTTAGDALPVVTGTRARAVAPVRAGLAAADVVVGATHVSADPPAAPAEVIHAGPVGLAPGDYLVGLACAGRGSVSVSLRSGTAVAAIRVTCQEHPGAVGLGIAVGPEGLTVTAVPDPATTAALAWRADRT